MKVQIQAKTLEDLEFPEVLQQISEYCKNASAKEQCKTIFPFDDHELLLRELAKTSEYLASFSNENRIPGHEFDPVSAALKLLRIENSRLSIEQFGRIKRLALKVETHITFFKKFTPYYPALALVAEKLEYLPEIPKAIEAVIDRFGEVKDSASPRLSDIRKSLGLLRSKISQSFNRAMAQYSQFDYLDDIRESVIENRRVLAIKAMYRRKVKGTAMGTSKTGSIIFIEPEAVVAQHRELMSLLEEETEEIQRILSNLTENLRPFANVIEDYSAYLTSIDLIAAKARYAEEINAILPEINSDRKLQLRDAYHPLLWLTNKRKKEKTFPQTIELDPENRIIVISGPNAGGKSITLKTIGLLQVMLQSGMLIPVHERSSVCLFTKILTDIGDHQSIENHLSTYSYRLKNMNRFLKKCDKNTLFLIDEFGTGSDPELGGAMAETFLEVFYERESVGVITTHYANLKVLANELPYATNANMLFNSKTLEPTFQLEMGQPGSSFTFEVAQKNGIPYSLINKAKKKIDRGKVRFDATIAKLQKERSKMARTEDRLQEEEQKAREEAKRLQELNTKIQDKLSNYQELYDYNQRMIRLGTKVDQAAEQYFINKKKRPLVSELLRIVETENSKRKKSTAKEAKAKKAAKKQTAHELEQKIVKVRKQKKVAQKQVIEKEKNKPRPVFKVGDRVRMYDGKAVGSIDSLEKGKATVNYGLFTTNVSVEQLELVEATKK